MRVDGRDITVSGNLLQPLTRRTNDIVRVALAALFLAVVITSSLITRNEWDALEESVSEIVAVLTPTQSNLVYLAYGVRTATISETDSSRASHSLRVIRELVITTARNSAASGRRCRWSGGSAVAAGCRKR